MYKVISTFCGLGGSSTGYKLAGLQVLAAVEFLDYQANTYRLNNPGTRLYQANIRELDPLAILADAGLAVGELDIFDGSPPCSSFSTQGNIEKGWGKVKPYGNTKQRTDDLFYQYIRFLTAMRPKVFVAENVSGLVKGASKGHFNDFFRAFMQCDYTVAAKVLNAANYGVPQARERLIFIGVRNDLNLTPVFPQPLGKLVTLREAFAGITNTPEELAAVDLRPFAIYDKIKTVAPGGKYHAFQSLQKEHPNRPSRTITATGAGVISAAGPCHWDNRKFTIPELKAIQSFPQGYMLTGSYKEQAEGLGRAVPPLMMKAIAETIKTQILDKLQP
jgi:DNA (cytosine-5)-methyltransferase 1